MLHGRLLGLPTGPPALLKEFGLADEGSQADWVLLASVILVAVFAPLTISLYRSRQVPRYKLSTAICP